MNGNTKELLEKLSYHRMSWSEILDVIASAFLENTNTDKCYVAIKSASDEDDIQMYPVMISHIDIDTSAPVRMSLNHEDWPEAKAVNLCNFCDAIMNLSTIAKDFRFNQEAIVIPDPDDPDEHYYVSGVDFEDRNGDTIIWLQLPATTANAAFMESEEDIYDDFWEHDEDEDD